MFRRKQIQTVESERDAPGPTSCGASVQSDPLVTASIIWCLGCSGFVLVPWEQNQKEA